LRVARPGLVLAVAAVLLAAWGAGAQSGSSDLLYRLPEAGSYELPVIDRVDAHPLLGSDGESALLPDLSTGQCALVSFVYLHCGDASGCPMALASLQRLDRAVAARDDLAGRVRLVTVSFDPERDGPQQMAEIRNQMAPRGDWRFLTAGDPAQLEPVLVDYGQDVVPLFSENGTRLPILRHVAKVFLLDGDGAVRNIYSSGFLDHRILLRDVETLLLTGADAPRP
jgi:cytochrome oxidase Cu insertion factor (SCO1/SenC/PrrC family)